MWREQAAFLKRYPTVICVALKYRHHEARQQQVGIFLFDEYTGLLFRFGTGCESFSMVPTHIHSYRDLRLTQSLKTERIDSKVRRPAEGSASRPDYPSTTDYRD